MTKVVSIAVLVTYLMQICSECECLEINLTNQSLSEIPKNITSYATSLLLSINLISHVPNGIFDQFYDLRIIMLDTNNLTTFPNLTNVPNLRKLVVNYNSISYIEADLLNGLTKLEELYIGVNPVNNFPVLVNSVRNLHVLGASTCNLTTVPVFEDPSKVKLLGIGDNNIDFIPNNYFVKMVSLEILWVPQLNLHSFITFKQDGTVSMLRELRMPSNEMITNILPEETAMLQNMGLWKIFNTGVVSIPSSCPKIPSALSVLVSGDSFDLCACENVWLKQLVENGGNVDTDDVMCGGQLWSQLTTGDLLGTCVRAFLEQDNERHFHYRQVWENLFCGYPIHSDVHVNRVSECGIHCALTDGCLSFNFLPNEGDKGGRCALVAPSTHNVMVTPLPGERWQFYVFSHFGR